jgi:hypothetical protein
MDGYGLRFASDVFLGHRLPERNRRKHDVYVAINDVKSTLTRHVARRAALVANIPMLPMIRILILPMMKVRW